MPIVVEILYGFGFLSIVAFWTSLLVHLSDYSPSSKVRASDQSRYFSKNARLPNLNTMSGSNRPPPDWKSGALPNDELMVLVYINSCQISKMLVICSFNNSILSQVLLFTSIIILWTLLSVWYNSLGTNAPSYGSFIDTEYPKDLNANANSSINVLGVWKSSVPMQISGSEEVSKSNVCASIIIALPYFLF